MRQNHTAGHEDGNWRIAKPARRAYNLLLGSPVILAVATSAVCVLAAGCSLLLSSNKVDNSGDPSDGGLPADQTDAVPPGMCDPGVYNRPFAGSQYRFVASLQDRQNWYDAHDSCVAGGGHLVIIDSTEENDFVVSTGLQPWIGASDHKVEGEARWVTGVRVADGPYQLWSTGVEPATETMDCMRVAESGLGWDNDACTRINSYVCECDGAVLDPSAVCETDTDENCRFCGDECTGVQPSCELQRCLGIGL